MRTRYVNKPAAGLTMLFVLAAMLTSPGQAIAASWLDMQAGSSDTPLSARVLSMGGTAVAGAGSPFSLFGNPALTFVTEPGAGVFMAEAAARLDRAVEMRSFPVWDSFESYLTDNIYAFNANYYPGYAAAASYRLDLGGIALGLSGGYFPLFGFDYRYKEYIRDNNSFASQLDELLGINSLDSDGTLDEIAGGAALYLPGTLRLRFGFSASYLTGDINAESRVSYRRDTVEDIVARQARSMSGMLFRFGISSNPRPDLLIGFAYRSGFEVDGDAEWESIVPAAAAFDTTTGFVASYPEQYTFGVTFKPQNPLRTRFSLEVAWEPWTGHGVDYGEYEVTPDSSAAFDPATYTASDSSAALAWLPVPGIAEFTDDVLTFRVGVEHVFPNDVPFRFGLALSPHVADASIRQASFTAGTGWRVGLLHFDLGFEVATAKYDRPDLFPDTLYSDFIADLDEDRTDNDTVRDFSMKSFLSVRFQ